MTTSENDAKFALDIRDMYLAGSPEDGEIIYLQGKNAPSGLSGELNITTLSVQFQASWRPDPCSTFSLCGVKTFHSKMALTTMVLVDALVHWLLPR
jgi:hypothetical protein